MDVRERYEAALTAVPGEVIALHGLAEVADRGERAEVAQLIAPYLGDGRVRARQYAVQTTAALRGAASVPVLLRMLDDPSPGVLRAVGWALAGERLDPDALDDLWSRVLAATSRPDRDAARRAAFWALAHQDRWPRLVLACRALAAADDRGDDDLRDRAERLLAATLAGWNRSFTRPTPAHLDELHRTIPRAAAHLPPVAARDLLHLLDHPR